MLQLGLRGFASPGSFTGKDIMQEHRDAEK
jgi:hypothetical protein